MRLCDYCVGGECQHKDGVLERIGPGVTVEGSAVRAREEPGTKYSLSYSRSRLSVPAGTTNYYGCTFYVDSRPVPGVASGTEDGEGEADGAGEAGVPRMAEHVETWQEAMRDHVAYMDRHRLAATTRTTREREVRKFFVLTGLASVEEVTRRHVDQWQADCAERCKKRNTANLYVRHIGCFLSWCVETERIRTNPAANLRKLPNDVDHTKSFTLDEVRQLIAVALEDEQKPRLRRHYCHRSSIYLLAVTTGCRSVEIRTLRWRHVQLQASPPRLELHNTKTDRLAYVPLNEEAQACLREWRAASPEAVESDFVFEHWPDHKVMRGDIKAAGVRDLGRLWHRFRATAATLLAADGVAQSHVQALLRHKNPQTTSQIYVDARLLPIHAATEKLPKFAGLPLDRTPNMGPNTTMRLQTNSTTLIRPAPDPIGAAYFDGEGRDLLAREPLATDDRACPTPSNSRAGAGNGPLGGAPDRSSRADSRGEDAADAVEAARFLAAWQAARRGGAA